VVAQPVEEHQLDTRLAQLHAALAAIPLAGYADQTPAQARRTAATLRTLESMVRTHVGAAVRAVDRLVPTRQAGQLLPATSGWIPPRRTARSRTPVRWRRRARPNRPRQMAGSPSPTRW
jgi:hypothetical protein